MARAKYFAVRARRPLFGTLRNRTDCTSPQGHVNVAMESTQGAPSLVQWEGRCEHFRSSINRVHDSWIESVQSLWGDGMVLPSMHMNTSPPMRKSSSTSEGGSDCPDVCPWGLARP